MIRTTYKGRELKILKARTPGHVRQFVGGQVVHHGFVGTEEQALNHLKLIIDKLDERGPHVAAAQEADTYVFGRHGRGS